MNIRSYFLFMLDELPPNRPLYKDSGLWQIRSDDMEEILYQQGVNESFYEFISRVYVEEFRNFREEEEWDDEPIKGRKR